jgi:CubicO group peptidase (beta-lactamase class C family)
MTQLIEQETKRVITVSVFVIAAVAIVSFIPLPVFGDKQNATGAIPSPAEAVTGRVDRLFAQWNRPDSPGCSLAVSQSAVPVYERGYGMANLELGVPITPATVFHVSSISKQFTAMCILLLAQRGRLSLDDEARKYIPELPNYGSRLTIRHLLTHTSGLRDAFLLLGLAAPGDEGVDPNEAVVKILTRQRALNFTPGTEFQYNNGGYTLLASIVKRVSGQSLRAFAETNLFKPLGMSHTHFHDDPTLIVPHRASGYHLDAGGLHLALRADPGGIVGNAGLFTTAPELLLWEQNFANVRVGDPALVAAMQRPTVLTGGDTNPYGFGLEIGRYRGLRTIGHSGGDPGYSAYVVRYPDQGLAVAVLSNRDDIDAGELTQSVADIYLADVFTTPSPSSAAATPPPVSLSAEQLASKVGLYRDPSTGTFGRIFVRDGKPRAAFVTARTGDSSELIPLSADRFIIPGTPMALEFVPAAPSRAQELHVVGAGPKPEVLHRVNAFTPSSTELRAFAGEYISRELEVTYTLTVRDSSLVIQRPWRADVALQPISPDAFHAAGLVDVVKFSRDARRLVTGFTVHAGGVRSLRFDRVKRRTTHRTGEQPNGVRSLKRVAPPFLQRFSTILPDSVTSELPAPR